MNCSVSYLKFNPANQPELFPQVVSCYRDVFAGQPWNEWKKCTRCGQYWGINQRLLLEQVGYQHCGQPVIDFWPTETVMDDIMHEVTDAASCWLALDGKKVVGFCWGYPIKSLALEKKLGVSGLAQILGSSFPCLDLSTIAYQDEIGVLTEYRRRGIATELFNARLADFIHQGQVVGVVRTKTNPPTVTYQWYRRLGYQVIAEYGDPEGRVVMARVLSDLCSSAC